MENAMEIWKEIKGKGFKPDLLLYGTIIWGLCSQNKLEESELVFSEMKGCGSTPNHFIYTTLMDAYFKAGKTKEALNLLQEMLDNGIEFTVVTYCALIDGLCKKGLLQEAINYFRRMPDIGLEPNVAVFTALIDAWKSSRSFERVEKRMREMGMELDLYAVYFLDLGSFSLWSGTASAKILLDEMIGKGILPDEILCICLLRKYYKLGYLDEAFELQTEMVNKGLITGTCDYAVPNART
ncbi:putative pentatricopeptide repeat-containing protein [Prunus yedoensis var. nudiflora]|uniref:Putative pentatricopeptide repeat-containing protein n=1 Tax=Prunus yedoensis var. nudiflora TaxID=2094558 RepID=A0A314XVK3_PRUYE|nr:putative pentatricopeptide repeat-containing protein [Prunus yedoensis var. nudiflora]